MFLTLGQLVVQEDFNSFIHCEKFKSYTSIVLDIFQVVVYDPSAPQCRPVVNMVIPEQSLTALAVTNRPVSNVKDIQAGEYCTWYAYRGL